MDKKLRLIHFFLGLRASFIYNISSMIKLRILNNLIFDPSTLLKMKTIPNIQFPVFIRYLDIKH